MENVFYAAVNHVTDRVQKRYKKVDGHFLFSKYVLNFYLFIYLFNPYYLLIVNYHFQVCLFHCWLACKMNGHG